MITLRLPAPPSVNRTRKVNWANRSIVKNWIAECDARLISERQRWEPLRSPYEVHIILSENSRMDLDNCVKATIDYLVRIRVVQGDGPKHLRRLLVTRGTAHEGIIVSVTEEEPR